MIKMMEKMPRYKIKGLEEMKRKITGNTKIGYYAHLVTVIHTHCSIVTRQRASLTSVNGNH